MSTTNVLFEIGLEEMPARFLADTEKQLQQKTTEWLSSIRLSHKNIKTFVTPRRLAVVIEGLATKQLDQEEEAKGPAKKIALDEAGNWSKAAIGFTKGQGKSVDDIYFKEIKGTEYVFVNKYIEGSNAEDLLPGFKDVILQLNFPKNMRWANKNLRFVRPIRWIVALNNSKVIPFEIASVTTSNTTYGHRFLGEEVTISNPLDYQKVLMNQCVIADSKDRKQLIVEQIEQLETQKGWHIPKDNELLEEVTQLVEYPTVFFGSFSETYLTIPDEVLITSMKEHQRYFPVMNNNSELLPYFIAVRNGDDQHIELVAKGNEKVLKARLSDAMFFYEEDQKQSIEKNNEKLERMVFQEKLGTIADKVKRVVTLTDKLTELLEIDDVTKQHAIRAAQISKFDLVTNMVNEFTKLQGIMGEKYAKIFGEDNRVAKAINEHYMPRSANDALPTTIEGAIVSIADKLDTIIGCIYVGLIPSGSQDPYALRRQAIGVLQILQEKDWGISVEDLLKATKEIYQKSDVALESEQITDEQIASFFYARASFILKEATNEHDIIHAVLANGIGNISFTYKKAELLAVKKHDPDFKDTQEALVRVLNIAKKGESTSVDPSIFENEHEQKLYDIYQSIKPTFLKQLDAYEAEQSLLTLSELTQSIHTFFDHTMVMADNEEIKQNRISLLNDIASLINRYADLSIIEWKQQVSS
ncbi:Glycine--tRNA ligase beta subunit [Paraliobacillus sp. PM-2]|uniref:glycine--tRNA ligase subunit beta n=1 Tax=Paraliobacillus sp. PM-2 TaxID=1462524 RepID=UPI00061CAEEF|nr:glycine--tRNA ligase subunit beta [Paraliobacillus sp. PM-2]CQR46874.1 Glycine--tRNA ligase beta subunit [Paraliobacillus sp. PM-2]